MEFLSFSTSVILAGVTAKELYTIRTGAGVGRNQNSGWGLVFFFGEKSTSVAGVSFEKYKQEADSV